MCVPGRPRSPDPPIPRRWPSGSWARQVAGPQQARQGGWEHGPGPWWAVQGARRRGGGSTERVSHRFWARQALTAERGAHSWLAGRPALMSFPHGPEFPARHDHTGKTLPRPPPPQLPPSHRTAEGEGGDEASATGPPEVAGGPSHGGVGLTERHRGPDRPGSLASLSPPCPGLHTGWGVGCRRSTVGEITSNFGPRGPTPSPPPLLPVVAKLWAGAEGGCNASGRVWGGWFLEEATPSPSFLGLEDSPCQRPTGL